jgi:hypothetical protein
MNIAFLSVHYVSKPSEWKTPLVYVSKVSLMVVICLCLVLMNVAFFMMRAALAKHGENTSQQRREEAKENALASPTNAEPLHDTPHAHAQAFTLEQVTPQHQQQQQQQQQQQHPSPPRNPAPESSRFEVRADEIGMSALRPGTMIRIRKVLNVFGVVDLLVSVICFADLNYVAHMKPTEEEEYQWHGYIVMEVLLLVSENLSAYYAWTSCAWRALLCGCCACASQEDVQVGTHTTRVNMAQEHSVRVRQLPVNNNNDPIPSQHTVDENVVRTMGVESHTSQEVWSACSANIFSSPRQQFSQHPYAAVYAADPSSVSNPASSAPIPPDSQFSPSSSQGQGMSAPAAASSAPEIAREAAEEPESE